MASVNRSMVSIIDEYSNGRGWEWGVRDCIGLMFKMVNANNSSSFLRSDYLPSGKSYKETCAWLASNHPDPMIPYIDFLQKDAKLERTTDHIGAQIIIMYGGKSLYNADKEEYPIHPVPGIAFQTSNMAQYAMFLSGVKEVIVPETKIVRMKKFKLQGLK